MTRIPSNITKQEISINGSLFVAALIPLINTDPGNAIRAFKDEHPKASHLPFAYIYGNEERCGDDGEPHNAAGKPYLELLHHASLDCSLLICARYFGGTKLGLPRLKKTFLEAAKTCILASAFVIPITLGEYRLTLPMEEASVIRSYLYSKDIHFDENYDSEMTTIVFVSDRIVADALFPLLKGREIEKVCDKIVYQKEKP